MVSRLQLRVACFLWFVARYPSTSLCTDAMSATVSMQIVCAPAEVINSECVKSGNTE